MDTIGDLHFVRYSEWGSTVFVAKSNRQKGGVYSEYGIIMLLCVTLPYSYYGLNSIEVSVNSNHLYYDH